MNYYLLLQVDKHKFDVYPPFCHFHYIESKGKPDCGRPCTCAECIARGIDDKTKGA